MSTEGHRRIEAAAADWLARRDAGDWTEADQLRFERWLSDSPLHRVAFLRLEHVWERALRLKALGAGIRSGGVPPPGQWALSPFFDQKPSVSPLPAADDPGLRHLDGRSPHAAVIGTLFLRNRVFWPAAAAVLLAVALYVASGDTFTRNRYSTPIGGVASVPMSDGSIVTLNTNSEIHVAVTQKERLVNLDQGEAFFEVAKDPSRPFIVVVGDERIVAVGTKFSVRREDRDVRVVVTEGEVRVESAGRAPRKAIPSLTPGTVARASDAGTLLQRKPLAEAEEILSWRTGMLVFRETTLAEAIAEFNRYNTRKISIEGERVAELRVAGNFRATNVDAFVRLLELGYPLRAQERGAEIILRAR